MTRKMTHEELKEAYRLSQLKIEELEKKNEKLKSKLETIFTEANNLIYFDDLKTRNIHNLVACIQEECGEKEDYEFASKYLEKEGKNV